MSSATGLNRRPGSIEPAPGVRGVKAYSVPRPAAPVDLHLDGNEGAVPSMELVEALRALGPAALRRYPKAGPLEARLAEQLGVSPARVLVSAGGDDSIDRMCRSVLAPGRNIVFPQPSFEMIGKYAELAGAEVRSVPWAEGPYPVDAVIAASDEHTAVVAIVTPNNPTGAVATAEDLRRLSAALPSTLLLVDLAYVEFADEDLSSVALSLPNALIIRTFSKAWGLAGLRLGYSAGPESVMTWMRAAGAPYAVSRPSIAMVTACLERGDGEMDAFVARVRGERTQLGAFMAEHGARPLDSQGNFVFGDFEDSVWIRDAMAGFGIGVRAFPGKPMLEGKVRITCPGDEFQYARLEHALGSVLAPEAILFDMDGVLADVSKSYRQAIIAAAAGFGVTLSSEDIAEAKREGDANNDWVLTRRMLARRGVEASLPAVTERFEAAYQGGLWREERLLVPAEWLRGLAKRIPLGIVTGRPEGDAQRFLEHHEIAGCFQTVVCMHDAPPKPDPAPVMLAMSRMKITRAWMIGDTPDDIRAARGARVLPLGVTAPGEEGPETEQALTRAGAARMIEVQALEELLP